MSYTIDEKMTRDEIESLFDIDNRIDGSLSRIDEILRIENENDPVVLKAEIYKLQREINRLRGK